MSVINSMLRDLDRRHAPLPVSGNIQAAPITQSRVWPRTAIAVCVLIILVVWGWNHHAQQKISPTTTPMLEVRNEVVPANSRSTSSLTTTRREPFHGGSESASMPPTVAASDEADRLAAVSTSNIANKPDNINLSPIPAARTISEKSAVIEKSEKNTSPKISIAAEQSAPIIKQERENPNALNDERYELARSALAQNQPQRAYELLRDDTPPIASATDYHAVLAAVEQQLGHYADASLRYQQLLLLDQHQASWWLGLALSLEGAHRNSDALAAYQRAAILNSLPDAARQYVNARIAALGPLTSKVEAGQ